MGRYTVALARLILMFLLPFCSVSVLRAQDPSENSSKSALTNPSLSFHQDQQFPRESVGGDLPAVRLAAETKQEPAELRVQAFSNSAFQREVAFSGDAGRPGTGDPAIKPVIEPRPAARPALGKKFWFAWGAAAGLAVADAEMTARCAENPTCVESNPIFGKRPSRAKIYALKGAPMAFGFYLSRRWKRDKSGDTTGWWAIPVIAIGANGFAVGLNLWRGH